MARHVSPSNIGLLILVELYADGAILGNAVLPVLSFLASHILTDMTPSHGPASARASRWNKTQSIVNLIVSIKSFEELLGSYAFIMGMPGRRLWDEFLHKLWAIDSLNALHEFFERLLLLQQAAHGTLPSGNNSHHQAANRVRLSYNSPFGVFVRKACLEFKRLHFHECADLWKDLVRYRQPTAQYIRRRNHSFAPLSFDSVLLHSDAEWGHDATSAVAKVAYGGMLVGPGIGQQRGRIAASTDEIECLLDFQVERMQKFGSRVPVSLRHKFGQLLHDSYLVPSVTHYLSYLDAWRAGDYTTSFDLLHRYFDYTMQYRDRLFYQYALMNLAVLQADFGCHKEAVSAMLETVSTARENRDMTCLNFALNWLFHFGRAHPQLVQNLQPDNQMGFGKESLTFLRVKAKETGMWSLWSSVLLSEAKLALVHGDSLASCTENMARSSQLIVDKNMASMMGAQLSLKAALWNRAGLTQLSTLTSEVFLRCYATNCVFDEELKHVCRISIALCERGRFDQALERLQNLDQNSLRSWKSNQYWHKYKAIVKLKRNLHHHNLDGAGEILEQLLQSKDDDFEPDLTFFIDSLNIDYLSRRGDLVSAFLYLDRLRHKYDDDSKDIALRIKLLLLKVSLFQRCGRVQRAFSTVIRAARMAKRARQGYCLLQALMALANILVSMAEFEAALNVVHSIMPHAYECESWAMTAQIYGLEADAFMGIAGSMEIKSRGRNRCLKRALAAVQKAYEQYSWIEESQRKCEMMAKKAVIMKLAGEVMLAADYAAASVELRTKAKALSLVKV
ncbi:hypothetical protein CDD82_7278 [Ophiocordyceps australis]|uniref:Anaphase-promoting complex subunit 5 n=1 Tax=Ophiocordyceps australis TaxID=1399860 RepID=A0A2C5ZQB2_9HYPO|nr:hypothetical protein CDD82_7278 [Ophiocordyceps australis]